MHNAQCAVEKESDLKKAFETDSAAILLNTEINAIIMDPKPRVDREKTAVVLQAGEPCATRRHNARLETLTR